MSYSKKILKECGLTCDGTLCYLDCNTAEFTKKLRKKFYANIFELKKFISDLSNYWETFENFSAFYGVTETKFSDIINFPSGLHLILSVSEFQEQIFPLIIEKMIIYHFSRGIDCITTHSIVHHVVAQFRWLNELRDGTLLLNLLIDAIKSLNDDVIADVIILFPDIFDYRHHDRLAQELKILLTSTTNIFSIIYYVLGCLTLSVPLQNEIHLEALELLENVPLKDAPYLITFLLKNVINFNESRENTIVKIRERLIQYHISNPKMPENEQISSINNCWSSIEFGIRYVKRVPEIIIKVLSLLSISNFTSVDFILFVLLYGIYDKSKLFKIISSFESPKKEATSLLYFDRIFTGIIMAHVENFLEFCDKLIRLKTACAIHFYKKSFLSLFTHLDKTVVSYARSNDNSLSSISISLLNELVYQEGSVLINYTHALMKLVSSNNKPSDSITLFQMIMFLNLQYRSSDLVSSFFEIEIWIRDMLESSDPGVQILGVSGYATLIRCMCKHVYDQKILLQDSKSEDIEHLLSTFYSNSLSYEAQQNLYHSFDTFIQDGVYDDQFCSNASSYFINQLEGIFLVENDGTRTCVDISDSQGSKCVDFVGFIRNNFEIWNIFFVLSASRTLKFLVLFYLRTQIPILKKQLKNFSTYPLILSSENSSHKLVSYFCAIVWTVQILNACVALKTNKDQINTILSNFISISTDFLSFYCEINGGDFWQVKISKPLIKKKSKKMKRSNRKSSKQNSQEIDENELLRNNGVDFEDCYENYSQITNVLIDVRNLATLDYSLISLVISDFVSNYEFHDYSRTFLILRYFELELKKSVDIKKRIDLLNYISPIVSGLIKILSLFQSQNTTETLLDDHNLESNPASVRFLAIKCLGYIIISHKFNKNKEDIEKLFTNVEVHGIKNAHDFVNHLLHLSSTENCLFFNLCLIQTSLIVVNILDEPEFILNEKILNNLLHNNWKVVLTKNSNISIIFCETMENIFENLSDSKKLNHLDLMVRSNMDKLFDEDHPVQNNITLLTKETFPIFCKLAFSYSFKLLKSYAISKSPINFENLETLFKIYNTLFSSIKRFNNREMLRLYLKHGTIVIKLFNQKYLPMFDKIFVDNKSNIQALFRNFQHSTRMLQHICRHAKVLKETSLMNSIPNLKKLLETFIYRVKVMLDKNKCADAFWIGHLKNRDIYGHEVMSQTTSMDD